MPLWTGAERWDREDAARGTGSLWMVGSGLWPESWSVRAEKVSREAVGSNGWGGSLE